MNEPVSEDVIVAAEAWARSYFDSLEAIGYLAPDEEDEPDLFLVILAVRGQDIWQAVEVWVEDGEIVSINDLGEGVPPEGVEWPWLD